MPSRRTPRCMFESPTYPCRSCGSHVAALRRGTLETVVASRPAFADLVEPEEWNYQHTPTQHPMPILYNYLHYTYRRLAEENKIAVSDDGKYIAFNTGLVTPNQEPVFALSDHNHLEGAAAVAFSELVPTRGVRYDKFLPTAGDGALL